MNAIEVESLAHNNDFFKTQILSPLRWIGELIRIAVSLLTIENDATHSSQHRVQQLWSDCKRNFWFEATARHADALAMFIHKVYRNMMRIKDQNQ